MKVSIVIPVYNVDRFLARCLDSIQSQTFIDICEVILIDDGSTDDSGRICDMYGASNGAGWTVLHQANQGLSAARNAGIDSSNGEYLLFVDSDDYVHPQAVERAFTAAIENDADIVEFDFVSTYSVEPRKWRQLQSLDAIIWRGDSILENVLSSSNSHPMTWTRLYRANLFEGLRFPVGRLHEDEFTTPYLAERASTYVKIKDVLYAYYQRKDSIMGTESLRGRLDAITAFRERYDYFHDYYDGKYDALNAYACLCACKKTLEQNLGEMTQDSTAFVSQLLEEMFSVLLLGNLDMLSLGRRAKLRLFRLRKTYGLRAR